MQHSLAICLCEIPVAIAQFFFWCNIDRLRSENATRLWPFVWCRPQRAPWSKQLKQHPNNKCAFCEPFHCSETDNFSITAAAANWRCPNSKLDLITRLRIHFTAIVALITVASHVIFCSGQTLSASGYDSYRASERILLMTFVPNRCSATRKAFSIFSLSRCLVARIHVLSKCLMQRAKERVVCSGKMCVGAKSISAASQPVSKCLSCITKAARTKCTCAIVHLCSHHI